LSIYIYFLIFIDGGRQSSSTSTDSGLHIHEKIICDWPIKSLSMSIIVKLYFNLFYFNCNKIYLDNPYFIDDKPGEEISNRRYDRPGLQSFSEIWKSQEERGQDFITVSSVSLNY